MLLSRFIVGPVSVGVIILGAGMVSGQDYPNKPIRIITATPGGGGDFAARLIAQAISGPLGQPVIVDNRTTILAAEAVSKASPDGYTLVVQGNTIWVTPLLLKTSYDMVRDFSAISLLLRETSVLAVHPSLPVKSVKELIALAKVRPGELNYAASGIGSASHLAAELFKSLAGVNIVHIPFKGTSSAIAAVIGGEVQLTISTIASVMPQVKSGKLRALGVTSAQPTPLAPILPTVAASGLPGYESVSVTVIFAPAKTPAAIIARLNQEIVRALNLPDVKEKFLNAGVEVVGSSPEELAAAMKSDTARWAKVIKDAGIKGGD